MPLRLLAALSHHTYVSAPSVTCTPLHTRTHLQRDPHSPTHAAPNGHTHAHCFLLDEPGVPDPHRPRGGAGPGRSQGLGLGPCARRAAAGDSSVEASPGRAALAPALCYANSPSQLVPAACTMSARSPRQPLPAREWGRGAWGGGLGGGAERGGRHSVPWVWDPGLAQPGEVGSGPISSLPPSPLPHACRAAPLGVCRASTDSFQSPRLPALQVPGLDEK